jgi:hypothetical protein
MGEGDQVREDQAGMRRATATDRLVAHEATGRSNKLMSCDF